MFSLRKSYSTNVTECIHKKLQLQEIYCTVSLRILLIFSTHLGQLSIRTLEFSEANNLCLYPIISFCGSHNQNVKVINYIHVYISQIPGEFKFTKFIK